MSLRQGYRYQDTLTKLTRTTPLRVPQLHDEFAGLGPAAPLRARPLSDVEAYLLHMQQGDMRKRNPRISSKQFAAIRKQGYGKTEGRLHRRKRQGKLSSVYIPKAKRKKKKITGRKKLRPRM